MRALLCLLLVGCAGDHLPAMLDAGLDGGEAVDATAWTCFGQQDASVDASLTGECPVEQPPAPDRLDETLALVGLDRCRLGYTPADWSLFPVVVRRDPYRLPWFDAAHDHAVQAPPRARAWVKGLDQALASAAPVTQGLLVVADELGLVVSPCLLPPQVPEHEPLARAVAALVVAWGGEPDLAALEADAADVPLDLQRELAAVLFAVGEAQADWLALEEGAGDHAGDLAKVVGLLLRSSRGTARITDSDVAELLAHRFDQRALLEGALRLAYAVERAGLARFAGVKGFSFDQATPLGRVRLGDGEDHLYQEDAGGATLFLVDTGGDDRYLIPVGAVDARLGGGQAHVSVAIDCAGRDLYGYAEVPDPRDGSRLPSDGAGRAKPAPTPAEGDGPVSLSETPRQGAARMGYGLLFELGDDDDEYRSLRMSQGFGAAGVGVLYDEGGGDLYQGEAAVQGAGVFGVGLLIDGEGNDTYRTYTFSQGFAFVRAAGLLLDGAGDDSYEAESGDPAAGGDPLYFNPQLPGQANTSFAQGAGFGRRAPGGQDLVYMSGGIGMLRDRSGSDRYRADVFAQGTGYWFGSGVLADGAGDDEYDGRWYVQAAAAHFALALLLDDAGADRYNSTSAPAATSIGVGHDYSVAWHIDGAGDDVYHAPGLSLGAGYTNGLGVFVNLGGDDLYRSASEPTLGCAALGDGESQPARWGVPTVGIFVEVGGEDTYDVTSPVARGNGLSWIDVGHSEPDAGASEHGGGIDRAEGEVVLP